MRPYILVLIYAALSVLDAEITVYLSANFPDGRELNPYVDPTSRSSMLFSPVALLIHIIFVALVIASERNFSKTRPLPDKRLTDVVLLAYFSLFIISVKVIAVTNNLMPIMGLTTPISYVLEFMRPFPGDDDTHHGIFWSLIFLLLAPLGTRLIKRIFIGPQLKVDKPEPDADPALAG